MRFIAVVLMALLVSSPAFSQGGAMINTRSVRLDSLIGKTSAGADAGWWTVDGSNTMVATASGGVKIGTGTAFNLSQTGGTANGSIWFNDVAGQLKIRLNGQNDTVFTSSMPGSEWPIGLRDTLTYLIGVDATKVATSSTVQIAGTAKQILSSNAVETARSGNFTTTLSFADSLHIPNGWFTTISATNDSLVFNAKGIEGSNIIRFSDAGTDQFWMDENGYIGSAQWSLTTRLLSSDANSEAVEVADLTYYVSSGVTVDAVDDADGTLHLEIVDDVALPGTGAFSWVDGTTAQRPGSPTAKDARFNTTTGEYEGYRSGSWLNFLMQGDGIGVNFGASELIIGATANDSVYGLTNPASPTLRLVTRATGTPIWFKGSVGWTLEEEWLGNSAAGSNGVTTYVNGTGASASLDNTNASTTALGILRLDAGTAAASNYAGWRLANNFMLFGGGVVYYEARIRIEDLSDATDEYQLYIGYGDEYTNADHTDGIWFHYDRTTSSDWLIGADSAGTQTTYQTETTVVADTWIKLGIETASDGSSAEFFIDDVSVGSITSGTPTGAAARACAITSKIFNTTAAGSTPCAVDFDYVEAMQIMSSQR